jgi:DNA-binding SARP family transcriptional activator
MITSPERHGSASGEATMIVHIRLLGRPSAEVDGRAAPGPRGRKAWALLAVLLLADVPPSRRSLADLLFPEADDPLGALRWTMSQLRRGLGDGVTVDGDPVTARLGPGCRIDLAELLAGPPGNRNGNGTAPAPARNGAAGAAEASEASDASEAALDLPEPLLVGADGLAGPEFDLWLTAARHRVDTARAARLRGTAGRALAGGEPSVAVAAAARAVAIEPHQPDGRAALVSSLVAAGDHAAALAQLREWSAWIRRELRIGRLLGEGGRSARGPDPDRGPDPPRGADDALSRIDAGQAALAAGAATAGLEHLRDAVRLATKRADDHLQATALFALGGGLVHAFAAHAVEGTEALREAVRLARRAGDRGLAAEALRDLAFVENTSGRVEQARRFLAAAEDAAGGDPRALSSVRGIEGMVLGDRGEHGRAAGVLRRSARLAESTGRLRQAAWSTSIASRSLLLRGDLEAAAEAAELSAQLAGEERWIAMLPWMDAILAELDLEAGRVADAERRLRGAWSMSNVLGDWCWQGMTARGLGLAAFARGDLRGAIGWLDEAVRRAERDHDRYVWVHAWVQDGVCRVTVPAGLPRARADVARLATIATSSRQPDFTVRADLHRAALGVPGARDRARAVAATLDNPALARMAARKAAHA